MEQNMKISVITVSYNAYYCIEKTIKSVICQRYDDFEYIIVDGCSTDGTIDVIKKYQSKITRWISEPDNGIYNAMNKAVLMAKGEYCIFMNAGDMFANPLVLKQVSLFLDDGFDVLTGSEISTKKGKAIDYVKPIARVTKEHFYVTSISHQSSFIKRTLLLEYPYDENLKLVSDWKFWLQTIVFGGKTYRPIDVDICLFNHDGITYSMKNLGEEERNKVVHEMFSDEDIVEFSKRYDGLYHRIKNKFAGKINRILNTMLVKRKMKAFRAYIKVLGVLGLVVAVANNFGGGKCKLVVHWFISRYLSIGYRQYVRNEILPKYTILQKGKYPVWVCWWQGEEMMPLIPKVCIKKLRENLTSRYELIVISKNNYKEYLRLPDYIVENVNNGKISITNFSDIIRFGLLSEYGGLWIDATCYTTASLPDTTTIEFYSSKQNKHEDSTYVSRYRWASYLIGGCQRLIFVNMYNLFLEYCKKEKVFVHYLLVDYLLNLVYEESPICHRAIDNLEVTEPNILCLQNMLNDEYDKDKFPQGIIHKLSWKIKFIHI